MGRRQPGEADNGNRQSNVKCRNDVIHSDAACDDGITQRKTRPDVPFVLGCSEPSFRSTIIGAFPARAYLKSPVSPKEPGRVEESPSEVHLKRFLFQKTKLDSSIFSIVAGVVREPS